MPENTASLRRLCQTSAFDGAGTGLCSRELSSFMYSSKLLNSSSENEVNDVICVRLYSRNSATAVGSPEAISWEEFLIILITHSESRLSRTPARAGPINFWWIRWQGLQLALKIFPPGDCSLAAAGCLKLPGLTLQDREPRRLDL